MEEGEFMAAFDNTALRTARKAKKLTQADLAEMVGCEDRYLRGLESGKKKNPSFLLVSQICSCLDISMEQLLTNR